MLADETTTNIATEILIIGGGIAGTSTAYYIVTGLSSSGFEQGPMSGKLLADYIHNGNASPILSSADPARQVRVITV